MEESQESQCRNPVWAELQPSLPSSSLGQASNQPGGEHPPGHLESSVLMAAGHAPSCLHRANPTSGACRVSPSPAGVVWEHRGGAAQEITCWNSKMAINVTEGRAGDLVLSFRRRWVNQMLCLIPCSCASIAASR